MKVSVPAGNTSLDIKTESVVTPTGIIIAKYVPGSEVKLGSFEPTTASDAEIDRRKKWSNEEEAGLHLHSA